MNESLMFISRPSKFSRTNTITFFSHLHQPLDGPTTSSFFVFSGVSVISNSQLSSSHRASFRHRLRKFRIALRAAIAPFLRAGSAPLRAIKRFSGVSSSLLDSRSSAERILVTQIRNPLAGAFEISAMAGERERWVLMATARSPTNIAVIKYWGKRDETLILPINDSISVTLDPDHLSATTTVAVSPSFERDRMWLNGKEISLSGGRYQNCLREIRSRASDVKDVKKGISIQKEDWQKLHVHIASYNNFPTAAGLASSAAGFACLVFALAKLMHVEAQIGDISSIARQGSGSACRSLYGGFVKWTMGKEVHGRDSIAVQLANEMHWDNLVVIVAVVSSRQKETSSTTGMRESVETSPLLQYRAKTVVPSRILQMEEAIRNRDFSSFAKLTCADSNQFHAVCLDTSPPIFYMNDTSHRIISLVERWNQSEGMAQVAYTFDAGPNAVLIAPNRKIAGLLLRRLLFYFPPPPDNDLSSFVLGDKSIMHDAGLKSMKDVEDLSLPPEIKDMANFQKYAGDVSYFICTRPGRGPVLLEDDDQARLSSETGLPK